jgi:FG-GAP-like repeat/ASPIC and UnbV
MRQHPYRLAAVCLIVIAAAVSCRRAAKIPDETHRQAITAFYVSLAALQTSQDAHARAELDRLLTLVPDEPAGWANLGLLLLRQQQMDEAAQRLSKAMELAPRNAPIARLMALTEGRRGNLAESIRHWRRAMELDPSDFKAPYALAQELERAGGADNEAEAIRVMDRLAGASGNLVVELELARLAAKRGDTALLRKAIDAASRRAPSWPADAKERLARVRLAADRGATEAATPVIFLKNVLIRDPEYRSALAAVATPRSEIGEPLMRFVALKNPDPQPAPPDEQLAFAIDPKPAVPLQHASSALAVWLSGDGGPVIAAASAQEVRVGAGAALPFPSGTTNVPPGPYAVAPADLNYDFKTDLVLAGAGGLRILRQGDAGALTDVTAGARLPADVTNAPLTGAWAADIDVDGDLDIVAARRDGPAAVLRNNGDGTFASQSPFADVARVRGFVWADIDGEGVPDAAIMDEQGVVRVRLNLRGSRFQDLPVPSAFPRVAAIGAAEITGDGLMDLVGVTADGRVVRLSRSADGRSLEAAELVRLGGPSGMSPGAAAVVVADLDNNGAPDFVISDPRESRVALGGPDGGFRPATTVALAVGAAADVDGDGRVDLIGRADDGARVARASGQKKYHWQIVRPKAATANGDQRINSFGIGGEVEVRTGLHAQKQMIASPVVHFGLGDATRAEVARITWPNGVLQSEFDLEADRTIAASQRLKGSCPWLFAWDGSEMRFVTDFIWRSPLGLRINAQATADVQMTEDWIRIRGDQLAARGGAYDLRIAAELWETHFFDLVSLLVVDHPSGTEVFVDERFAVPPPTPGFIVTTPVAPFRAVRDDRGGDVREIVGARDDRHLDVAGRGAYQGVTRAHHVELELPEDAPRSGPLWLIAQGWVHPTDSSINVALGQGRHPPPEGLSLHAADRSGRFRPVRTGLGFPAGKDKTILIDLEGVFGSSTTGARRLRLATNMEIFWDRLGWAAGRPGAAVVPRRLDLRDASLRFRGYSVTTQREASSPERPRYVIAGTAPRWRDLEGFHTRFGDVRELLLDVDDRYVIMNAGDELRLAFPEAPPTASGMTRDFILVGDGWVKDGDYNTTASGTVLPLPTHRLSRYVEGTGRLEDDPVYRRHRGDFERYHTRYVSPEDARDALRGRMAGKP